MTSPVLDCHLEALYSSSDFRRRFGAASAPPWKCVRSRPGGQGICLSLRDFRSGRRGRKVGGPVHGVRLLQSHVQGHRESDHYRVPWVTVRSSRQPMSLRGEMLCRPTSQAVASQQVSSLGCEERRRSTDLPQADPCGRLDPPQERSGRGLRRSWSRGPRTSDTPCSASPAQRAGAHAACRCPRRRRRGAVQPGLGPC